MGCNCGCGSGGNCTGINIGKQGPQGIPGIGTPGTNGQDGQYGGFAQKFVWDANTSTPPDPNSVSFNNATLPSVTEIYISETNSSSINVATFIDSFANSGNYGRIRLFKEFDSTKFWIGDITNVVDNGVYQTLTVSYIGHNGVFNPTENIVVEFTQKGANGQDGTSVITSQKWDINVAANNYETPWAAYHLLASPYTLLDIVVPLDKCLQTNEDEVMFNYSLLLSKEFVTAGKQTIFAIALNDSASVSGAVLTNGIAIFQVPVTENQIAVNVVGKLTRISATTFRVATTYNWSAAGLLSPGIISYSPGEPIATFDTTDVVYSNTFTYNSSTNPELHIIPVSQGGFNPIPFVAWYLINLQAWYGKKLI